MTMECKKLVVVCFILAALRLLYLEPVESARRSHHSSRSRMVKDFRGWIHKINEKSSHKFYGFQTSLAADNSSPDYSSALVMTVAQGKGKGDFTRVQDAIDAVPSNNQNLILIRVKPGIYRENVTIPADKPFIILSGSSANNTVISWNANAKTSGGTFYCATVTVFASDFVARYITIENTYGPGDQAVALRISGDRAAFYGCYLLGYQDTVLDESGRHYFQNCYIEGATDFICGNGRSLYEKCHLHSIPQLNGAITAQKRSSPDENTGFTFLNCKITGAGLVFLGRAWGQYSRVVFAYTYMADIIFPEGWSNWNDASREKTVFYGQYKCSGPGASITGRVPWSYQLTDAEAKPFLTNNFIDGQQWIKAMPSRLIRAKNLVPAGG